MTTHRQVNFLEDEKEPVRRPRKPKTAKKVVIFLVILVLLFTGCKALFSKNDITDNPLDYDPVTLEPKAPKGFLKKLSYFVFNRGGADLAGDKDDRINILLLGMGGVGHDGPYLTDTIMIASIKPSTNQIALISIPRDLGVSIPGYGTRKINHANAFGEVERAGWGAAFATEVISDTFKIDIPYYVRLDFKAFEDIINDVGGIKVDVARSFTDPLYPAANDQYQTATFRSGVQTMDGNTALKYARSRHGNNGEGSDFARAARQQKILLALKQKLLSFGTLANPVRINNVINSLETHLTTNLEFSEIVSFIKLARDLDAPEIKTLVLDNGVNGYLQNAFNTAGSFILEPKTKNFTAINTAIENVFNPDFDASIADNSPKQDKPSLPEATIEIQNGTWKAGLAARIKKKLIDQKFIIGTIRNAQDKPTTSSGIYKVSEKDSQDVLEALQNELKIPIKQSVDTLTTTSTSDIVIILGTDYNE